jgi:carbon storage regulator
MLVLSRQIDESIVINDNIVITVLAVEGERVKIGIQAPREIVILRQELWKAINDPSQPTENRKNRLENKHAPAARTGQPEENGELYRRPKNGD